MPQLAGGGSTAAPKKKKTPPLKVAAKNPTAAKTLPLRSAANKLNEEVGGKPVVKVVKRKKKADVTVGYGLGGAKYAGLYKDKPKKDRIKMNRAGKQITPRSAFRGVLEHELGHALGLPHKDADKNLMSPGSGGRNLTKRQVRVTRGKRKGKRVSDALRAHRGR